MGKKADKWKAKFKLTKELLEGVQIELLGMQKSRVEDLEGQARRELQTQIDKLKEELDNEREDRKILQADFDDLEVEYNKLQEESENERWDLEEERDRLTDRVTLLEGHLSTLTDHLSSLRVTRVTLDVPQLSPEERVHLVEEDWEELDGLRRAALQSLSGREEEEDEASSGEWS